jgi:TolB-like protein
MTHCTPFWRRARLPALLALLLATLGGVAEAAPASSKPMVAVLYFDYDGAEEELFTLRKGFAQMIGADLVSVETIGVVERDRLQELLSELELQRSRHFDPGTAVKIGKLLGAQYMVFGLYFQLGGVLQASARVVDTSTGVNVYALNAMGPPGDFLTVQQKLSGGMAHFFATKLPVQPDPKVPVGGKTGAAGKGEGPKQLARKPPKRLDTKTAVAYSKALEAIDHKEKATAIKHLQEVLAKEPDFALASDQLTQVALN